MTVKTSRLTKTIPAVGWKAGDRPDVPKKVLMSIQDRDTGATKCAAFVEIADTEYLRRLGLSKRASIGPSSGMYFDCHGPFWMKDVEFPLDLCYLDENGAITEKLAMAKDKSGSTLYPRASVDSVQAVEFPAGFCKTHGVRVGDVLVPLARID